MYERKYIEAFKTEIIKMFKAGCRDKFFYIGAGIMLEKLNENI